MNQNSLVQNIQDFKKVPTKACFKRKSYKNNTQKRRLFLSRKVGSSDLVKRK